MPSGGSGTSMKVGPVCSRQPVSRAACSAASWNQYMSSAEVTPARTLSATATRTAAATFRGESS